MGKHKALLAAAENFTVLIKNPIEFPLYSKRRSNIVDSANATYLQSCLYNEEKDPFCPVFRLVTMGETIGRILDYVIPFRYLAFSPLCYDYIRSK